MGRGFLRPQPALPAPCPEGLVPQTNELIKCFGSSAEDRNTESLECQDTERSQPPATGSRALS